MKIEFCVEVPGEEEPFVFAANWPASHLVPRAGELIEFDSVGATVPSFTVTGITHSIKVDGSASLFIYADADRPMSDTADRSIRNHPLTEKEI